MQTSSDDALVKKAQDGDERALSDLLARYERLVYNLAFRLTGNHADASDAAQEALVRVYTRLHNFRGESAFSTWLFRVATNACLDEIRRQGRRRCESLDDSRRYAEGGLDFGAASDTDNPILHLEQREVQDSVQQAINRLPVEYRTVILLRDLQDYSYGEIAKMLQTSLGTIKSRLHRARLALRAVLLQHQAHQVTRVAG